jgi:superfamily I DNA and RNA helicase
LPFITSEEWLERGYYDLPSAPPVLCEDNLGKAGLLNTIKDASLVSRGEPLGDEAWQTLLRTLSGMAFNKTHDKPLESYSGRAGLLQTAKRQQHRFDLSQEIIAKQIPPGPQRIRGIAGSGKTVLLCQKAAQMHLKHPDWDIAFVFHTRSLYDLILNQLDIWLQHFTGGEQGYDPHNSKLKVLHAWGSREQAGFYRTVSFANGVRALTLDDIPKSQQGSPPQNLAYVVASLLGELERRNKKLKPCFDAMLVDEGQDLVVSEKHKYQDKQPFYDLAFQSLCPAKLAAQAQALFENATLIETAERRRLIWAYDEAQSLDSLVVPSYKEIFGEELSGAILSGGVSYPGGIAKHQVIERCYRTPGQILVAAHALGMGLLRKEGILSALTTKEDWGKLGYEVEGDFRRTGSTVTLRRPRRNSPNAVPELYGRSTLTFHAFKNRRDELETVAAQLSQDLEGGLNPSRDVLVIVLGQYHEAKRLQNYFAEVLQKQGINFFVPGAKVANVVNPKYPDNDPNSFWREGP